MRRLLLLAALALLLPGSARAGLFARRATDPVAACLDAADLAAALSCVEELGGRPADDPALAARAALAEGELARRLGREEQAAGAFRRALAADDPAVRDAASLGLAILAARDPGQSNAWATLELVPEEGPPPTMNADRYRLLALRAWREGRPVEEVRELARRARVQALGHPDLEARVRADLGPLLEEGEALPAAGPEALAATVERARAALEAGRHEEARDLAHAALRAGVSGPEASALRWVLRRVESGDPFHARRVGILLPLSGTYGPAGRQVRDALDLAMQGRAELVVRDTEGDPGKAVEALEALVLEDGVAAVVGPLLQEPARAVAREAQAAGVPVVLLSTVPGLTDAGPYAFRGMLTVEMQVRALVQHAWSELDQRAFAVLAPDIPFGHRAAEAFAREVELREGSVVRTLYYDPEATDYREVAAQLGHKDEPGRAGELRRLRREAEERGEDPSKVVLPPRVDFDAIFIPDDRRRVALVVSALAWEEFSVGTFRALRATRPVGLLGLNGWHHPDLPRSAGRYVEGCRFVDAWGPETPQGEAFVERYRQALDRSPSALEAMAWDVGRLLAEVVEAAPPSRGAVRTALLATRVPGPVAGAVAFDGQRELQRVLQVFTVRDGGIELVEPESP